MKTNNIPEIKLGIIASSRNNFNENLSIKSRDNIAERCVQNNLLIHNCSKLVEFEEDAIAALKEVKENGCNALVVILGNFGPETAETIIAKEFNGPVMYVAATEDAEDTMYHSRRDSYCGMLNCSYNLDLRNAKAYIPHYPIGTPQEIVGMIEKFIPIARAVVGLSSLKVIIFGPRPNDFLACNAPLKPLFNLGIEVQENSEMDLLIAYKQHQNDSRIEAVVKDMLEELGGDDKYIDTIHRMAQYELTLLDWMENNSGARQYVTFANKCWPGFQQEFGFLPCYVNSRLAAKGIPVACETDVYGSLSEYIGLCVSNNPVTILDINNSIPQDLYNNKIEGKFPYNKNELFMGFHCGNTSSTLLADYTLKYKMNRKQPDAPETGKENNRGTLEGRMIPGQISCFRLHSSAEGNLQSYIAQGEILPVEINTYGCYALFGVAEMNRFYRYVLLDKHFPHHSAIVYGSNAEALYDLMVYLEIPYIGHNYPGNHRYEKENPFI